MPSAAGAKTAFLRSYSGRFSRFHARLHLVLVNSGDEQKLAKNESFFRQVNERIKDVADGLVGEQDYEFLCECSDPACTERLTLTTEQYEWVRAKPARFVLARGHTVPEVEHVVEREDEHVVIEKRGIAGRVAAQLDPRAA